MAVTARGRKAALFTLALGVGLLLASGIALRVPLLEWWYIRKLESKDPGTRQLGAMRLGDLRSTRGAYRLLGAHFLDPDSSVREASLEALIRIGTGAAPALGEELLRGSILHPERRSGHGEYGSVGTWPYSSEEEKVLGILLLVQKDDLRASSVLRSVVNEKPSWDMKTLVWRSGIVSLEGRQSRVFVFDQVAKSWPGSQPQIIVILGPGGKILAWKEVGGEPMYHSALLEEKSGQLFLEIACAERRRPDRGIYRYRLSTEGIDLVSREYSSQRE